MDATVRRWLARHGALLAVLALLALSSAIRLRLADAPLERDEGEYAYAAQLILHGAPPYALVYNMKLPGVYYTYALMLRAIGETPQAIRIGLTAANVVATLVLFFIGGRLLGKYGGAIAAMAFALMSLDQGILGTTAHATHFALVPALAATWILLSRHPRPFALVVGGVLLGLAVLITQQMVFWCAIALYGVARDTHRPSIAAASRRVVPVLVGIAVPLITVIGVLAANGVLHRFLFWTVRYASAYASKISIVQAPLAFASACHQVAAVNWPLWVVGLIGFIEIKRPWWPSETRRTARGLLLAGFLGVVPGFYFREHYFVLLVPAVALGVAIAMLSLQRTPSQYLASRIARVLPAGVFLALAGGYVFAARSTLFLETPRQVTRQRYGPNPFWEAEIVGQYLAENTNAGDRILVLGSEPEIYFYARRRSATGYIYGYPLAETQPYRDEMLADMRREVIQNMPAYAVVVDVATSWYDFPDTGPLPPSWVPELIDRCFELDGVADIVSPELTVFVWGNHAATYIPLSDRILRTYKRRTTVDCQ